MLSPFINSISGKVLALLILFLALDYFPVTGIFLMMVAGPFIAGLLVHVLLISILIEAATGRLPREFVLIPIFAFCGYYAAYIREGWQVRQISAALRTTNPGKVYDFDPKVGSLVMDRAYQFVETHDIPVAYEAASRFPEGYTSVRPATREQCNGIKKDALNRISLFYPKNLCLITVPERPPGAMVKVTLVGDKKPGQLKGMRQQTTEISVDGRIVGSFRTASVQRLPAFPIFAIGCALNDGASTWDCFAQFLRSAMVIDGIPQSVDGDKFDERDARHPEIYRGGSQERFWIEG